MTTIPSLPFSGQQLRDTLTALDGAIDGKEATGTAAAAIAAHLAAVNHLVPYVHQQSTPATTWTINHNMGKYPTVELFNSGMQEIDADISHPSVNQTVITLNPATAGQARLI